MNNVVIIVILLLVFLVVLFGLPSLLIAISVPKVIKIFRKKYAVGINNAKSVEELGLQPRSFIQRLMKMRDYKPRALEFLIQMNVVQVTEDGKVYLSEDMLSQTRWRHL